MEFEPATSSVAGWQSISQVVTNKIVTCAVDTSLPRNVSQQILSGQSN